MMREDEDGKCVVFSQWSSMLDLVGAMLKREAIEFVRLDGAVSQVCAGILGSRHVHASTGWKGKRA